MQPVPSSLTAIDSSVQSPNPEIISQKKKKKKRSREDDQIVTGEGIKKKKKKRNSDDNVEPTAVPDESLTAAPKDADPVKEHAPTSNKKKRKDKGKGKGNENDMPPTEQTDAEIEASSQASAAALLSAIVATMSNSQTAHSPAAPQIQQPLPFNPHLPGQQFLPFLPMQIGFPAPQDFQNSGAHQTVFAHPQVVPGQSYALPNGISLSDLAFGSNEDVLRALQELDVSKIASTLKNLGETAAGPSLPAFPSHMPFVPTALPLRPHDHSVSDPLPPPVPGQVSVPLNRIMVPTKTVSSTGQKRTIDMNLPGNEQHTNPTHAHLLANKWLNASKLAELVRDQGMLSLLQIYYI
jgi:hypothetical protein